MRGVPGPDNRLDRQQPWSATFGLDYMLTGVLPARFAWAAACRSHLAIERSKRRQNRALSSPSRSVDLYANVPLGRTMSVRLVANNVAPLASENTTAYGLQSATYTVSRPRTWYGIILSVKG